MLPSNCWYIHQHSRLELNSIHKLWTTTLQWFPFNWAAARCEILRWDSCFQSAATLPTLCSGTLPPPELAFKDHPCVHLSATMHISNDLWLCFQNSFCRFLLLLRCAFILGPLVQKVDYNCDNIDKSVHWRLYLYISWSLVYNSCITSPNHPWQERGWQQKKSLQPTRPHQRAAAQHRWWKNWGKKRNKPGGEKPLGTISHSKNGDRAVLEAQSVWGETFTTWNFFLIEMGALVCLNWDGWSCLKMQNQQQEISNFQYLNFV